MSWALLPSMNEVIILFVLIVISVFWLLDSNFSILLNFVLLYILVGLFVIMLGYEFLGISLLLIYSSGIAIIFIITSMIVGTKHISLLFKSNSTTNDRSIPTTEEVTLNFLYIAFFILIFLTINFSGDFRDSIYQLLVQNSLSNFLTFNSLALLNDTFILGFLIYNQYATHTIVSGFVLLISLISSIYISQVK